MNPPNTPCALILSDNIFHGHELPKLLQNAMQYDQGACVFAYHVQDPQRYGIVTFCSKGKAVSLEEKPNNPASNCTVTGLYFYDRQALRVQVMGRGFTL